MINIEDLNTWDVYVMVMNAKPLSASKLKATKEFNKKFDDLRGNDAVEENWLEDWEIPFVKGWCIYINKWEYVGTGYDGDEISILNGADYVKKGKRVKGSICYGASDDYGWIDENIPEYMSFDDALQSALYWFKACENDMRSWKESVREHIYKNRYNENKYLSVYEFDTDRRTEYYLY